MDIINEKLKMNKQQAWEAILGELELSISKVNFTTWFKNTSLLDYDEKKAVIAVPSIFHRDWIKNKYEKDLASAARNVLGEELKITYEVKSPNEIKEVKLDLDIKEINPTDNIEITNLSSLNPKYTFESFIVGPSNKLAQAACLGVVNNPGHKYNPLFIYGGVGLGKTHLIQSVGNEILKKDPNKKIIYTSSERFTNDFIESLSSKKTNSFKNKYRNVDVLIIDDIQFLAGKESTQEEFFHTFNSLYQSNKQIVLTSDRPPQALNTLQERIKSRFEGGMIADIQAPDIETRIAIIQEKNREKSFSMSSEVMEFIAKNITQNVRELEGALMRVMAYCELNETQASLETVKSALETVLERTQKKSIKTKDVLEKVASFYDIKVKEILSPKRNKEIAQPRQIVMYLLKKELHLSYPQTAKALNREDHTTAMYAEKKIDKLFKERDSIRHDIEVIKDKLYNS